MTDGHSSETSGGRRYGVAYAPGVFDLFHIGHLNLIRQASSLCDRLIVGVLTDALTVRRKNILPVVPFSERLAIVAAIDCVDEAVPEDRMSRLEIWDRLHFDALVKGDDWKDTAQGRRLEADFARVGVDIAYVPYTATTSSTRLRVVLDRLANGVA